MSENEDLSVWDDAADDVKNEKTGRTYEDGGSLFLRFEKDKSYTVRLIAQPECFRLHWQAFKSIQRGPVTSPAFKDSDKDKDVAWSKGGWMPQKRYAVPVLNREINKIQIMEGGADIFNPIFALYSQTKKKAAEGKGKTINPAGEPAPDWIITVGSTPMKNGKDRMTFTCQPDIASGMNYFTDDDKELISKFTYDWHTHYSKKTSEEISALWESLPDDKKYHANRQKQISTANPNRSSETNKTASIPSGKDAVGSPVPESEDPFGNQEEEVDESGDTQSAATLF